MVCLDWWVFELMIVFSGWLGVQEQTMQIIMLNIVAMAYMVAIGLEAASCSIIGQLLGRGDVVMAKKYMSTFFYVSSALLLNNIIMVYFFQR